MINDLSTGIDNAELLSELFDEITDAEVEELGIVIEKEGFAITSEGQANFFLRRLEEARNEKDKINNTCDNEINKFNEKVNAFRSKEVRSLENAEAYYSTLLEKYASIALADSKKKSLKLPFGTLAFKTSPVKYIYDDEVLMKYIKDNDLSQFIRVKEEINKKDLKTALIVDKETGSISINDIPVNGVNITPGELSFSIK